MRGAESQAMAPDIRRKFADHLLHHHFRHAVERHASVRQRPFQRRDVLALPGSRAQDRWTHQIAVGVAATKRRMCLQRICQVVFRPFFRSAMPDQIAELHFERQQPQQFAHARRQRRAVRNLRPTPLINDLAQGISTRAGIG